jgi:hypothetical protein
MSQTRRATPSFEWKIASAAGVFTGEQKADLADRMQSIAEGIAAGQARVAFDFGEGFVSATISPKVSEDMSKRAQERARRSLSQGLQGWVARAMIFLHGLDASQRDELAQRLAQSYLRDELAAANAKLQETFIDLLRESDALSSIKQIVDPAVD